MMFDMKFKTDGFDARGVFDVEVFVHENIGVSKKDRLLVGVQREFCPFGIGVEFG